MARVTRSSRGHPASHLLHIRLPLCIFGDGSHQQESRLGQLGTRSDRSANQNSQSAQLRVATTFENLNDRPETENLCPRHQNSPPKLPRHRSAKPSWKLSCG